MNKLYVTGAIALLTVTFAGAQGVAEQTSDQTSKEAQVLAMKASSTNPALNGQLKALLREREDKIKALRMEYEAKVKALRDEYQAKLQVLVGNRPTGSSTRPVMKPEDRNRQPMMATSTMPMNKQMPTDGGRPPLNPSAANRGPGGQVRGSFEDGVGAKFQNFFRGFFGGQ